jgi:hypothetical protein
LIETEREIDRGGLEKREEEMKERGRERQRGRE